MWLINGIKSIINWLTNQVDWAKSFFQEPSGKGSVKRLIMFLIAYAFLKSYLKVAIATEVIVDIPDNWAFLLAGIIGLGILDKYVSWQKDKSADSKA